MVGLHYLLWDSGRDRIRVIFYQVAEAAFVPALGSASKVSHYLSIKKTSNLYCPVDVVVCHGFLKGIQSMYIEVELWNIIYMAFFGVCKLFNFV